MDFPSPHFPPRVDKRRIDSNLVRVGVRIDSPAGRAKISFAFPDPSDRMLTRRTAPEQPE